VPDTSDSHRGEQQRGELHASVQIISIFTVNLYQKLTKLGTVEFQTCAYKSN